MAALSEMLEVKPTFPIWYRQPFKAAYVFARAMSLLVSLPVWTLYYLFTRPRPTWTLKEAVFVRFFRGVLSMNAAAGLNPMTTNKDQEVPESTLKETSFLWIDPIEETFLRGHAADSKVKQIRVPGYVWPKGANLSRSEGLIGLFIHGGGYMVGNGGEHYPESRIASRIQSQSKIKYILSVDYRLVHEASHPAQLMDALSAYAYLVKLGIPSSRIILIGACAGGHLALMLVRYLYDEKVMDMPKGIMLFSPWVDMEIDWKIFLGDMKERPNAVPDVDLLSTSVFANLRFLGAHPISLLSSPLLSANLAPPGSYRGYPRCFISVGECDVFRNECEGLVKLMGDDGVDVTLDVQDDAVHDFWGFGGTVPSNKARDKLERMVVAWVSTVKSG